MIKANELRIGNWVWKVYAPYGQEQSREYVQVDIEEIKRASGLLGVNSFWHEPIPLTPDTLLKCGAVKAEGQWQFKVAISALWINFRFNASHCYAELGGIYLGCQIKYVHQLQNLIHALTGTELSVNL